MTDDEFPLERVRAPEITTPARIGHAVGATLPGGAQVIIVAMNPTDACAVREFLTGQPVEVTDYARSRQVIVGQCPWDNRP